MSKFIEILCFLDDVVGARLYGCPLMGWNSQAENDSIAFATSGDLSMLASIDKDLIWPMLNIHCISLLRVSSMINLFMRFFNLYTLW